MYFDGAYTKDGEALILGLEAGKKNGVRNILVFGDSELVVQQINQQYQCRHPRMRSYRNNAWDMVENVFYAFNITLIPQEENNESNALATIGSYTFIPPLVLKLKHEVELHYHPPYQITSNTGRFFRTINK